MDMEKIKQVLLNGKNKYLKIPEGLPTDKVEAVNTKIGKVFISKNDQVIRPYLKARGQWEPGEEELFKSIIFPGARFLDIGANVGFFTVFVSKLAPRIEFDCVEPIPENIEILKMNLWEHNIDAQIWPVALDDSERVLQMVVSQTNMGDSRAGKSDKEVSDVGTSAGSDHSYYVPSIKADELFAGRSFDVVKIDTQGWELDILRGMRNVIDRSKGIKIVAEFWPEALRARGINPVSVLEQYDEMGFDKQVLVAEKLLSKTNKEIMRVCDEAGKYGQVNLLLSTPAN